MGASNRGKKRCYWCGADDTALKQVTLWGNKDVWYCRSASACVRRKQKAEAA